MGSPYSFLAVHNTYLFSNLYPFLSWQPVCYRHVSFSVDDLSRIHHSGCADVIAKHTLLIGLKQVDVCKGLWSFSPILGSSLYSLLKPRESGRTQRHHRNQPTSIENRATLWNRVQQRSSEG